MNHKSVLFIYKLIWAITIVVSSSFPPMYYKLNYFALWANGELYSTSFPSFIAF